MCRHPASGRFFFFFSLLLFLQSVVFIRGGVLFACCCLLLYCCCCCWWVVVAPSLHFVLAPPSTRAAGQKGCSSHGQDGTVTFTRRHSFCPFVTPQFCFFPFFCLRTLLLPFFRPFSLFYYRHSVCCLAVWLAGWGRGEMEEGVHFSQQWSVEHAAHRGCKGASEGCRKDTPASIQARTRIANLAFTHPCHHGMGYQQSGGHLRSIG